MRLKYEKDGKRWTWYIAGDDERYFQTSSDGEGIQEILCEHNVRRDLEGTCQFSVRGVSDASAKKKIRHWMENHCWY